MTPERLQELKALCEARPKLLSELNFIRDPGYLEAIKEFITAARTALPELIEEMEQLRAHVAWYMEKSPCHPKSEVSDG